MSSRQLLFFLPDFPRFLALRASWGGQASTHVLRRRAVCSELPVQHDGCKNVGNSFSDDVPIRGLPVK